jgi:hypothetical protein
VAVIEVNPLYLRRWHLAREEAEVSLRLDGADSRAGDHRRGRVEIGVHRVSVTKLRAEISSSFAEVERELLSVCGCEAVGAALVEVAPEIDCAQRVCASPVLRST